MSAIMTAILSIIDKVLGLFKSKADKEAKKIEILNQKEFREAKEKLEKVKRKDENEKLVKIVNSENKVESDLALEEIRKRLGK